MRLNIAVVACAVLLAACGSREESISTDESPGAATTAPSRGASPAPGRLSDHVDRIPLPPSAPAGMPVGPVSAKSLALTPAMIERAIVAELAEGASGIDVTVDRGIVHLGGDVRSEADFQRANYVARAIDGVIEVDQSQMRVAR